MEERLEFKGGWKVSFIPMLIFFIFCILLFVVFKVFDMHVLAMGGFVGLIIGSLFVKNFKHYELYWNAVLKGVASPASVAVVIILFIISMFSELIKATGVSNGFLWLANTIGMSGGLFVAFTFITCCIISAATGSSIGTMFAAFPIFFPAGVASAASPMFLSGAIVGGCIFGDNLAPISDTTIASVSTQTYRNGVAPDVAGVVTSRFKYSSVAATITTIIYLLVGGIGGEKGISSVGMGDPTPLVMLIPVLFLIIVAVKTSNIFASVSTGIITGTIVALLFNLITPADVFGVSDGAITGFLADGIFGMMGTVALVMSVFGIMGVLQEAGALDKFVNAILNSNLGQTVRGTEIAILIGIIVTTLLFGGVTSASILTFGPIANKLGSEKGIHPYRRANLLDGFAHSIPHNVPFLSVFIFIGSALTGVSPAEVAMGSIYTVSLFVVFLVAVITGWGLVYEGENGEELKEPLVPQTEK